jgi:aspartyl-tRNA(Asn)/glutamyl-tRNA(Gln) amidotransferase subunit C
MKITEKDVEYIANLARLKFNSQEKKEMIKNLEEILEYMDQLKEINTDDVEPTAHVLAVHNVLRNDQKKPSLNREEVLKIAPDSTVDGFYRVPKIIE